MFMKWLKRLGVLVVVAAIAAGAYTMIKPQPVPVDIATIARGDIETTIDEEGQTRVKDIYRVSAPTTGKLERLALKVGDEVKKGTQIARIRPVDPPIRDMRTRRELAAAAKAAQAAVNFAVAEVTKAGVGLKYAKSELERAKRLVRSRTISAVRLEQAELEVTVKQAQLVEAEANLELHQHQLDSAKAREMHAFDFTQTDVGDQCCVGVIAPVAGTVLKVLSESEKVVPAGQALLELGDLTNLELVVDLLSADAVAIAPGTIAHIEGWGGKGRLSATVRRIDPAGFTKVSALGIEEQRVNVVLDISDPQARWEKLGHSYRVLIRLVTADLKNVVRVPLSALFRKGDQWAVYSDNMGMAEFTPVTLGKFSLNHVEVVDGLSEGVRVIVYPSDRVKDGTQIVARDGDG